MSFLTAPLSGGVLLIQAPDEAHVWPEVERDEVVERYPRSGTG